MGEATPIKERFLDAVPLRIQPEVFGQPRLTMQLKSSNKALEESVSGGCECCNLLLLQIERKPNCSRLAKTLLDDLSFFSARPSEFTLDHPLSLTKLREPDKVRDYLATGDHLALCAETSPPRALAEFEIYTKGLT